MMMPTLCPQCEAENLPTHVSGFKKAMRFYYTCRDCGWWYIDKPFEQEGNDNAIDMGYWRDQEVQG